MKRFTLLVLGISLCAGAAAQARGLKGKPVTLQNNPLNPGHKQGAGALKQNNANRTAGPSRGKNSGVLKGSSGGTANAGYSGATLSGAGTVSLTKAGSFMLYTGGTLSIGINDGYDGYSLFGMNNSQSLIVGSWNGSGVTNSGTVSPGFSAGHINFIGDPRLTETSNLHFQIGEAALGTGYNTLVEAGGLALTPNGSPSLSLINGFDPTFSFPILVSNQNLGSGTFSNVAPGERLVTRDESGSFQVDYSPSSPTVVVHSYNAVPEPGSVSLVIIGAAFAAGVVRRRRS